MQRKHWKRAIAATLTGLASTALGTPMLFGQTGESAMSVPAGLQNLSSVDSSPIQYLPFAHFNIPFDVDPSGPLPREVHLWVSPDRGRSWLKYASTTPDKRSFEFHAAAEGEYLFAVQTRDGQGDSALAASPPMRVLIDTTQPELQLSVDVSPAGQLVIDYQISDPFLVADSVRLTYRADGQAQWEEVRVGSLGKSGDAWSGRTEIDMPRCRELDVRIIATDQAQNKAERVSHFSAPRTAAANSGMQLASQRGDYQSNDANQWVAAARTQPLHSAQRQPQAGAAGPNPGLAQGNPQTLGIGKPVSRLAGPLPPSAGLVASQGGIAWNPGDATSSRATSPWTGDAPGATTARTVAALPGSGQAANAANGQRLAVAPSRGYEELPPPAPIEDTVSDASPAGELQLSDPPSPGSATPAKPFERQLPVARRELANIELEGAGSSLKAAPALDAAPSLNIDRPADAATDNRFGSSATAPSATMPNVTVPSATVPSATVPSATMRSESMLNPLPADAASIGGGPAANSNDAYHSRSRTFSLDYAVDSLRGAAVSDIELWGTEDQGRTWQKWGSDPDRQSPFDVQVGNDGLFGFRMVVIGSNGLVSNRPESGDQADMWINVDTQMPSVNITRALYGEGEKAGMLVIDFTGTDDNMHDRPVTLSYSERPTGPWVTIASGLPASGNYVWRPDPNVPKQVYLRAQAVDRAGNTHEHRLELPVNLRGMAPQGRIQGFRPIAQ